MSCVPGKRAGAPGLRTLPGPDALPVMKGVRGYGWVHCALRSWLRRPQVATRSITRVIDRTPAQSAL